ncbi:serotransferrin [Rhinatrema bivittatum]|uniref:serotransferrin n=1 Tax=Rhinatrema bivittatum TaxID=194408 RepID=UPI00112A5583|nr:serotransferrin [Rhinatrema bivittatum]
MRLILYTALSFALLALSLADPQSSRSNIIACVKSKAEYQKCGKFMDATKTFQTSLLCLQKTNTDECSTAISNGEADFMSMDGGDVLKSSLQPYGLNPIIAECYGKKENCSTSYFAVAVVKKESSFKFSELKGKRTCHTGLDKSAGYIMPVGTLLEMGLLPRQFPIVQALAQFFSASCIPGANAKAQPNLCSLCKGKDQYFCARSENEPYYNYEGALRCLEEDAGVVAFVKHTTAKDAEKYMLLCPDDTRKPLSEYKDCNLGRISAHAVMARSKGKNDKTEEIVSFLMEAQEQFGNEKSDPEEFCLFRSSFGKDLLFKDSTGRLEIIPNKMDAALYLGSKYISAVRALREEETPPPTDKVRWCAIGREERQKCDTWSALSGGVIDCITADYSEEGMAKILKGEADAMTVDGGFLYTAGECGLVPVLAEYYKKEDISPCNKVWSSSDTTTTYFAVAIVKSENKDITWTNLEKKKSCHTAINRQAGWIIPFGQLNDEKRIQSCNFGEFFSESCAPGAERNSSLCALCIGNKMQQADCQANTNEPYFGYSGTLRCLNEKADVAFAKHTTIFENTDGNNPASWAQGLKSTDFMLLCRDGSRAAATEYAHCHLAQVPSHIVICPPEKRDLVARIVKNQQELYGRDGFQKDLFAMYSSSPSKDLLFKDSTQCLIEIPKGTPMKTFIGQSYYDSVSGMAKCSKTSDLLPVCTFHRYE